MRGRGLLVVFSVLVAAVAAAQSIRTGGGGGSGVDCLALGTCVPIDAAGSPVVGVNYAEGLNLFDVTDGTDSAFAASLYPGEVFADSVGDYAGLSLSTHTTNTDGAIVSRARLQAFPTVYAGTGPGGRALAGGVTLTMTGDDSAAVSTIDVTTGAGLSIGQGATEFIYLTPTLTAMPITTSGTPPTFRPQSAIAASGITLPACTASGDDGQLLFVDDTDDAIAGELCVCRRDGGGVYAWVRIGDNFTACVDP